MITGHDFRYRGYGERPSVNTRPLMHGETAGAAGDGRRVRAFATTVPEGRTEADRQCAIRKAWLALLLAVALGLLLLLVISYR